jgi:Ca2+:H+ antiporter
MIDNAYRTRMQASREAGHSSRWNFFSHGLNRRESAPQTWQASNELEGQPLTPATTSHPPTTSGSDGKETTVAHPEHQPPNTEARAPGAESVHATITQGVLRRRASNKDRSSEATAQNSQETEKPKKQRTFFKHLTPKEPFTVRNQIQRTLFGSWINVLLLAAPVGITINYIHSVNRIAVFVVNFIAIVPLAAMLGFATEEIALRTGETLGGLLNATFG